MLPAVFPWQPLLIVFHGVFTAAFMQRKCSPAALFICSRPERKPSSIRGGEPASLSNHRIFRRLYYISQQISDIVRVDLTQRPTLLEFKIKIYPGPDVNVADINNRGPHSGFCHCLSGKLSSCTSAVVSGDKLMCRNYTEYLTETVSPTAANSNTRVCVCWLWNVLAQSSQRQKDDFIMSYHLQQLFFFLFFLYLIFSLSALFHFHHVLILTTRRGEACFTST